MRRLEIPVALAVLITPFSLAAQAAPGPLQRPAASTPVAEPAQPQDKKEKHQDQDREADGQRLIKEIKELADTVRSQMKDITKSTVSQRQKLEAQIHKLKEEAERTTSEIAKEQEGEGESERVLRRAEGQRLRRNLTQQQHQLESEIRNRVNDAHAKAQETLKSTSFQYEKVLKKLRALGESKAAEEAKAEYAHAKEESLRLLQEVIGRGGENPRVANRGTTGTGVAFPGEGDPFGARPLGPVGGGVGVGRDPITGLPIGPVGPLGPVGPVGPGPGGVGGVAVGRDPITGLPVGPVGPGLGGVGGRGVSRTGAAPQALPPAAQGQPGGVRGGGRGGKGVAEPVPPAAEHDVDAPGKRATPGQTPRRSAAGGGGSGEPGVPDREEVVKLRAEIKELRNEIQGLRDVLKAILKEKEKENEKEKDEKRKEKTPGGPRQDPASTPLSGSPAGPLLYR